MVLLPLKPTIRHGASDKQVCVVAVVVVTHDVLSFSSVLFHPIRPEITIDLKLIQNGDDDVTRGVELPSNNRTT